MPTTPSSRRNSQRSRRGSTPPIPGQNGSKLAGRIMWLPYADELSVSTGFSDESHNHPVLVLSKKIAADGKVDILFVSCAGLFKFSNGSVMSGPKKQPRQANKLDVCNPDDILWRHGSGNEASAQQRSTTRNLPPHRSVTSPSRQQYPTAA